MSPRSSRVLYIDNLRILLTSLVVVHHLAVCYGAAGDWYYKMPEPGALAETVLFPFVASNQAFFMGFFFLIAAHLTPGSLERKGLGRFMGDRLLRLGIPLVFYTVVINPVLEAMLAVHARGFDGSYWEFLARNYLDTLHVGPMWFVGMLLMLSTAFALFRSLRPPNGDETRWGRPTVQATVVGAVVVGLVTFLLRIRYPIGHWLPGVHIQPAHSAQYVTLFAVGILASRHGWLQDLPTALVRFWLRALPLAALGALATLVLGGVENGLEPFQGGLNWQSLVISIWEQAHAVGVIVLLLHGFAHALDRQGALGRAAAADSYTAWGAGPPGSYGPVASESPGR